MIAMSMMKKMNMRKFASKATDVLVSRVAGLLMFDFKLDDKWPAQRGWIDRFCARWVAGMINSSNSGAYQFGGYTGEKRLSYEMVDAEKEQLMHWILREAGYSCTSGGVKDRGDRLNDYLCRYGGSEENEVD